MISFFLLKKDGNTYTITFLYGININEKYSLQFI